VTGATFGPGSRPRVELPPQVHVQFDAGFALEMSPFGDDVVLARFAGAGLQVEDATISPVWGSRDGGPR